MTSRPIRLDRAEYDVCWRDLALGEHPQPLSIPGHSATHEDRTRLRAVVYDRLTGRGIARPRRDGGWDLATALGESLTLIARASTCVVSSMMEHPAAAEPIGAVAAWQGARGAVAELDPGGLTVWPTTAADSASLLIDLLPPTPPCPGRPVSTLLNGGHRGTGGYRQTVHAETTDERNAKRMLAAPVGASGLLAVHRRGPGGVRTETGSLHWRDAAHGRAIVYRTAGAHATVAPGDRQRILDQLRSM